MNNEGVIERVERIDRMDRISDDDEDHSTESEAFEEGDLLSAAMDDDVTAQLAAAGWQFKNANGDFRFLLVSFFPFNFNLSNCFATTSKFNCTMRNCVCFYT